MTRGFCCQPLGEQKGGGSEESGTRGEGTDIFSGSAVEQVVNRENETKSYWGAETWIKVNEKKRFWNIKPLSIAQKFFRSNTASGWVV